MAIVKYLLDKNRPLDGFKVTEPARIFTLGILLLAVLSAGVFPILPNGNADGQGTVCATSVSSQTCPVSSTPLNAGLGSQVQVAVNIRDSGRFNAFDVSVETDLAVLYPVSVDLTGSLIHDPRFIVAICINNSPIQGNCRTGIDGPGVVSVSVAAAGYNVDAPATGRLFSITYEVVGTGFDSPVGFQTGCANTSNNGFCVTIVDSVTGMVQPENLQATSFNTLGEFALLANPSALSGSKASTVTYTITVTSFGDFSGTVSLSTSISPATRRPPVATLSANSVTLSPGSSSNVLLSVSLPRSVTVTATYTITVTGTDGTLTHSVSVFLFVTK